MSRKVLSAGVLVCALALGCSGSSPPEVSTNPDSARRDAGAVVAVSGKAGAGGMLALGSFGIYLGRALRLNSWDVVARPLKLVGDISSLMEPKSAKEVSAFTVTLFFFSLVVYTFVVSMASWLLIEKPALALKDRRGTVTPAAGPADLVGPLGLARAAPGAVRHPVSRRDAGPSGPVAGQEARQDPPD